MLTKFNSTRGSFCPKYRVRKASRFTVNPRIVSGAAATILPPPRSLLLVLRTRTCFSSRSIRMERSSSIGRLVESVGLAGLVAEGASLYGLLAIAGMVPCEKLRLAGRLDSAPSASEPSDRLPDS